MPLEIEITTPNGHIYKQPTGLFIGNEFVASTGQTIASLDPAYVTHFSIIKRPNAYCQIYSTDKPIATVHAASVEDVDRAVQTARAALVHPSWKLLPATERGQVMAKLADLMEENRGLLASIDAWDNGTSDHHGATSMDTPLMARQENRITSLTMKTSPKLLQQSVTIAAGPTRLSDRRSTPRPRSSHTQSVSPSGSSAKSSHGTIRCPWQPGN